MDNIFPEHVQSALDKYEIEYEVFPCEPEYADTDPLVEKYGYPIEQVINTILVVGRSEPRIHIACVVLATYKVDVNKKVRKTLGVKSASFAPGDQTKEITGMEIGGVTMVGLPEDLPIWVDSNVFDAKEIMVGGGNRTAKILMNPAELKKLPNIEVIEDLGLLRD